MTVWYGTIKFIEEFAFAMLICRENADQLSMGMCICIYIYTCACGHNVYMYIYIYIYIWLWAKNRYPKWNPGKWKHGLKPAVPWWFNFDPYPYVECKYLPLDHMGNSLLSEWSGQTKTN